MLDPGGDSSMDPEEIAELLLQPDRDVLQVALSPPCPSLRCGWLSGWGGGASGVGTLKRRTGCRGGELPLISKLNQIHIWRSVCPACIFGLAACFLQLT